MLTFRTGVIGCKVNQIEIEAITAQLREYGFTYKKKGRADLGIINTCTVTAAADKKSLQVIKKLRRQCSYIVVTGCLTELNNLDHDIDCIDLVIPQKDKTAIPFILREKFINKLTPVAASAAETGSAFQQRTRAFIKIQDGCDNYCAYCRVALARGHPFSLPPAVIFKQIEQAVENKHPEIVLSGINIGQYSYQQISFNKLVARILEAVPSTLVRISSIEPQTINKNFYELFRYSNLVKHLHIPVQSGSDKVLADMGRKYTVNDFKNIIRQLRSIDPLFAVSTDFITAFPGETGNDFNKSLQTAAEAEFMKIHVFPYSPRPGTRAFRFNYAVSQQEQQIRRKKMLECSDRLFKNFIRKCEVLQQKFIVEEIDNIKFAGILKKSVNCGADSICFGTTDRYLKGFLPVTAANIKKGQIIPVSIAGEDPLVFKQLS